MQSIVPTKVRGWLFDVYPSGFGEMTVWVIGENGQRVKLIDKFQPKVYVSGKEEDIERLASGFYSNTNIASWNWACKFAHPSDPEKTRVLEIALKDCRRVPAFTNNILQIGDYLRYEIHNCDLHGDRAYLFDHDLFPLAFLEVDNTKHNLEYHLLDNVESIHYSVPPLRIMRLNLKIAKEKRIANFNDPIDSFQVSQTEETKNIDYGSEAEKLLELVKVVRQYDPDIVLTSGGDSFIFSYLTQRANVNDLAGEFILSRDDTPFSTKKVTGRTFFSYGRTFYRAPITRLFGRIHIDKNNTFILNESSFQGLFEIARVCRVPLHTASRCSIGSSMSSLQFSQATKDNMLLPKHKSIPEAFKSAYELLVGDRGGFIFEPKVGIHDNVGEVDFSSMYPSLMLKNNISAETVFCKCCPDSEVRIPELNYNICRKRKGIVPKSLDLILSKRMMYKILKEKTNQPQLKEIYDNRQIALKWILVTCFGYLGYKNSKFGTIDGHIGVCSFGREAFLRAAHAAEKEGFEVVHGIVDSLWLKKEKSTPDNYRRICRRISNEIGVPLNFEGKYKWIVFLPSKIHPHIGVLNRYYGVMENGKLKIRGLEIRKRDTPKFISEAQLEMINVLAAANNSAEFIEKIPQVIEVTKSFHKKLLDGNIPVWDLMVTKHLSKQPKQYKQQISQLIAAEQLIKEGGEIHAGNNVTFIFTDAKSKRYQRRVKAAELVDKGVHTDVRAYLLLLYGATANLLSFLGYTSKSVLDAVNGNLATDLTQFLEINTSKSNQRTKEKKEQN